MTGPATGPDGGTPVDRRWFEEALRSQGFVVEPPADDLEVDPIAEPDGSSAVADQEASAADPAVQRPPMPSALLARIAARGQAPALPEPIADPEPQAPALPEPIADPEPQAPALPEPIADAEPGPPAPAEAERRPPWASAVVAPVAPWSSPAPLLEPELEEPELEEPEPVPSDDPEPTRSLAVQGEEVGLASAAVVPEVPEAKAVVEGASPTPAADELPTAGAAAVLDSPYPPAAVVAAAPAAVTRPRPAAVSAAPEASEGELWALVGASEPAAGQAPASDVTRLILTILTAFLILVIVVGSLVFASQIA